MEFEKRLYQIEAQEAIEKSWETYDKTLLVLPTGTGKTIVFCKLLQNQVANGKRCLILAHRGELLEQAADKLSKATGLGCALEKASATAKNSWFRITVGSVQSLMQPNRLEKFAKDYYDVIIVDEAHHALAESYQRILNHFDKAKVLGVTATADRGDMRNLGEYFENKAFEYPLPKAINEGFLCPIRAITIPLEIDLMTVKVQAGDFQAKALGHALEPYLELIGDEMVKYCKGRKIVVFLPLIHTSEKMCDILLDRGFKAKEINGKSIDRSEILRDFNRGEYEVLCNSMLLTEGWDCPDVNCIVCLRPTKIRPLYAQMVGRGTRIHPGKENLLLPDFLWHTERHELARPAHLICDSDEVTKQMVKNMEENAGDEFDIEEAKEKAEGDAIEARENALAERLAAMRKKKRKLVDPLQFEMSIYAEDLSNYTPAFGWEMEPPNEKQKQSLENLGLFSEEIEHAGKAEKLLQRLDERRAQGLATPKQIRCLERFGFLRVGTWSFQAANKMIGRISACRWRVPRGVIPSQYDPNLAVQHEGNKEWSSLVQ
jgi:superfamily II DNA or RNA helicase